MRIGKVKLSIKFLQSFKTFKVMPKFLSFNLLYTNVVDSKFIH